jgi:hypothetical protein
MASLNAAALYLELLEVERVSGLTNAQLVDELLKLIAPTNEALLAEACSRLDPGWEKRE